MKNQREKYLVSHITHAWLLRFSLEGKKVRQNSLCLRKFWSVCPLTPQMTEWVEACTLIVTVCAWILSYVKLGAEWHREQVTSCQDSKLKFCFYQGPRTPEPHEVMALNHDLSHILRGEFRCPLQSANQTASCMLPASTLLHPGRFLRYGWSWVRSLRSYLYPLKIHIIPKPDIPRI